MTARTKQIVAMTRPEPADDVRPPEFSDDALALKFAEKHSDDCRYVDLWKAWMRFDGTRWRKDDTLYVYSDVRKVCRDAAAGCKEDRIKRALASATTVSAVERLARSDRRLAATATQWDQDEWLLNTPDGVWDLQTGTISPVLREHFLTKITAVAAGGACSVWRGFLRQVTGGDADLEEYLQRIAGYCLTGSVRENAIFFFHGPGANGKTTFADTLLKIAGDYGKAAPSEMLTVSRNERHSTDVAGLQGARIVTAPETHRARAWDEAKIKQITGGDTIAARLMKRDNVVFSPTFKILITGNHKPSLASPDEAMRRRLHLIPFRVTIPPEARDDQLAQRLRDEFPGILLWAIQGCAKWQRTGLAPPAAVREATAAYFADEDTVARWLLDHADPDANARMKLGDLFNAYRQSAVAANQPVGTQKDFIEHLRRLGFTQHRDRTLGSFWTGYRLRQIPQ